MASSQSVLKKKKKKKKKIKAGHDISQVKKGVRQGCALSPLLFNLYIADVELYMKRKGIGGVPLGSNRIWSLAYADDMVLLAKNREALLEMMAIFKRFCKDKDLKLNAEKTKISIGKRKRRWKNGNGAKR